MNHIETDTYADWILKCLGVYDNGDYLDKMEKDFEVSLDPTDSDTIFDIQCELDQRPDYPQLGNMIALQIYNEIVSKAVAELEANEQDFTIDLTMPSKPEIECKNKVVTNWQQIKEIYSI